jgi:hypothetical protein
MEPTNVFPTLLCSNALKNCKKADTVLYGMPIYEIIRHTFFPKSDYCLSFTFTEEIGLISVQWLQEPQPIEVLKLRLDLNALNKVDVCESQNKG